MRKALQGINLGGWLVVERWIPGAFDGVNGPAEIDIVRELGVEAARKRLTKHRETFITEKDFRWIKRQGFDFVRLPVGYWLFEETSDFIDGEIYIRRAFEWATKHHLGIILDFHGLQGSQNGKDHSGQVGKMRLYRGDNQNSALKTLEYMARTYGQEPALIGLEVINEPKARFCLWRLLRYYDRAYAVIGSHLRSEVKIIISDAFQPLKVARKLSKRPYRDRLVLDVHLYQIYSWRDRQRSFDRHVAIADESWWDLIDRVQRYLPVLVGEWSAALPPQAYHDGDGSESERVARYYQTQQRTFDDGAWAHAYWTYKAPHCGVWSWRESQKLLR
ncbi:MAG: cellulase family glycosylhydrolase [Candidatus Saccharimonadales bacterium]|jgi:glucan 1,3-beta-glucosidase